ncbi:DUF4184 family protein [Kitasatospora sp. NPDC054939]
MPFTLSHPAAVLPLLRSAGARGPLVASALVAGSLAPDVPYFAESLLPGVYRHGGATHRWWGVPTVDVALAGALVAGWHGLLRGPLVALLPDRWAGPAEALTARYPRTPFAPSAGSGPDGRSVTGPFGSAGTGRERLRAAGWFAASAAVGAATHVGWDAFTHEGRLGSRLLPVLEREVAGVPLYDGLQYGSSLLGLGVLGAHAVRELRARRPGRPAVVLPRSARRAAVAVLGAATAAGAVHRVSPLRRGLVPELCFGAGAGLAVGAAGYALAVRLLSGGRRGGPGGPAVRSAAGPRPRAQARRSSA